jgi:DNA-binding NarL/FixJ family response regulator
MDNKMITENSNSYKVFRFIFNLDSRRMKASTAIRNRRETLVIALYEQGKTYRQIAEEVKISPNSIKAILNKAGLDQSTSLSSRAYELFSKDRMTPLQSRNCAWPRS